MIVNIFILLGIAFLSCVVTISGATYKNIKIKKRGGGTRTQRVMVLSNGKYKFVKNKSGTKKSKSKKPKKKSSKNTSKGGSNTKRKRKGEIPLYQIVAGTYIVNKATGGAAMNMLEALLTHLATMITSGEYEVKNYTLRDDFASFISTTVDAYRKANRYDTLAATAKAFVLIWLWKQGSLAWNKLTKDSVLPKIPKSLDIGFAKVVIR